MFSLAGIKTAKCQVYVSYKLIKKFLKYFEASLKSSFTVLKKGRFITTSLLSSLLQIIRQIPVTIHDAHDAQFPTTAVYNKVGVVYSYIPVKCKV